MKPRRVESEKNPLAFAVCMCILRLNLSAADFFSQVPLSLHTPPFFRFQRKVEKLKSGNKKTLEVTDDSYICRWEENPTELCIRTLHYSALKQNLFYSISFHFAQFFCFFFFFFSIDWLVGWLERS